MSLEGIYADLSMTDPGPDEERIFMVFKAGDNKDGN